MLVKPLFKLFFLYLEKKINDFFEYIHIKQYIIQVPKSFPLKVVNIKAL